MQIGLISDKLKFNMKNGINFFEEDDKIVEKNLLEHYFSQKLLLFSAITKLAEDKFVVFFSTVEGFFGYKIF